MNLMPSNETISGASSSAWNQPSTSGNLVSNRSNWDLLDGAAGTGGNGVQDPGSQWLLNSGGGNATLTTQNSNQSSNIQNSSSSNSSASQLNSQPNQSGDPDNNSSSSPLMNEHNLPKNWSQVVDATANNNPNNNSTSSSTNANARDSPAPCVELTADQKAIKEAADKFTNVELYSDTWGQAPINQNTPWDLPASHTNPNYQAPPREVHSFNGLIDNSWKYASSTTGTEIWEASIRKNSATGDQLSPNELSQGKTGANWQSGNPTAAQLVTNHIGGNWGEPDDPMQSMQPSKMWNGPSNGLNSAASLNNSNWMGDNDKQWSKQWNDADHEKVSPMNSNKAANDALFSNWKDASTGWHDAASANAMLNDLSEDGTALWNKRQAGGGGQNARWKEDGVDVQLMNKSKLTNMTNQCANGINLNLNAHMQNGFSSASPGVLRIPSANKLPTMQPNPNSKANNWLDQPSGDGWANEGAKNGLANGPTGNGMFWNDSIGAQQQNNWNKQSLNSNKNDGWKLKKEMIMQSHQFKVLVDHGFRKENIETALRNSNMNMKDAIEELRDDILKETLSDQNIHDLMKRQGIFQNHPSSLPPNSSISNRNTSQFSNQTSQQPDQMFRNKNLNKAQNTANALPQDKRLGNLVQQIQVAVQIGHLNAQILNQPLGVNTIQLIYQMLQQIKNLDSLQAQANSKQALGSSELNVKMAMIKQRISNLQNQIKVQQAMFINQQNGQQSVPNSPANQLNSLGNGLSINPSMGNADAFKGLISPESPIVGDFRDPPQANHQQQQLPQSRLNTWRNSGGNFNDQGQGFSRAPGSVKLNSTANNPNNWFAGQDETTATWMNDAAATAELNSALNNMSVQSQQYDSVPEFEPGKPWKGSQIKSSDDDPHLTPGSVNRSILSLNNFNNWSAKSAANNANAGLSSNTWSFNNNGTVVGGNSNSSSNWNGFNSNESTSPVENLWQGGTISKGPPPGLSPNKESKGKNISPYLLIKNLTPQIDTSTLRTLCQQHGPLLMFNPMGNGLALIKYKSKEEAIKAQSALNNCYLSNTTILVDLILESEVQNYLSGQQQITSNLMNNWNGSNGAVYRNGGQQSAANPWRNQTPIPSAPPAESQWSFNGNLWNSNNNSIDASTLLPGDLLNGESA